MKGARFSEEQIITILKEAEGGAKVTARPGHQNAKSISSASG